MEKVYSFLMSLGRMLNQDGTEYGAIWEQVPQEYKEDFESWCADVKQQSWEGNWHRGWANYHLEYLRYVVDLFVLEHLQGYTDELV